MKGEWLAESLKAWGNRPFCFEEPAFKAAEAIVGSVALSCEQLGNFHFCSICSPGVLHRPGLQRNPRAAQQGLRTFCKET